MEGARIERIERTLDEWFAAHPHDRARAESIVGGNDPVSLRMLDWFCTNYAKNCRVVYVPGQGGDVVDVHSSYKIALATFHKNMFDPFGRTGGGGAAEVGRGSRLKMRQKNFFRWAAESGVLDYVTSHIGDIERDMSAHRQQKAKNANECTSSREEMPASMQLATIISNCAASFTIPEIDVTQTGVTPCRMST